MEEGREKVTAEGGVTRIAVSGSRTSEIEAKRFSADVDDCRVDAAIAGRAITWKAMEVSAKNEAEGKVSSVDEEVGRNQGSKGAEEATAVGDDHNSRMEGKFVVCEQIEENGKEQSPARVKAPPQTRKAVIRVESAETQDYVSEQQGLDETELLSFIPSAVSEPRWALHT